jgi:hypothetical protein
VDSAVAVKTVVVPAFGLTSSVPTSGVMVRPLPR